MRLNVFNPIIFAFSITLVWAVTALVNASTSDEIAATQQQIEQLSADIKTANHNKDKELATQLRQQRSEAQAHLRELKQTQRQEKKDQEKQSKRAAAEAQWETFPADKKLCAAVEYNRLDLVKKVLESKAIDVSQPMQACLYPLGEAVTRGFTDITEYLLQNGSPLVVSAPIMNAKVSAMDAAAGSKEDRTDILVLLKKYGATPFDSLQANLAGAVVGEDKEAKKQLKQNYNVEDDMFTLGSSFTKSLEKGNVNNIRWLLANGSNAEEAMTGRTALMIAVDSNDIEKVKLLVDAGADVNRRGVHFQSVLAYAEQRESRVGKKNKAAMADIVAYLKARGATYSEQERKGK